MINKRDIYVSSITLLTILLICILISIMYLLSSKKEEIHINNIAGDYSPKYTSEFFTENKKNESHGFLVGGHLYGSYYNKYSVFPSASLLALSDIIDYLNPNFFISLGDNYRDRKSVV